MGVNVYRRLVNLARDLGSQGCVCYSAAEFKNASPCRHVLGGKSQLVLRPDKAPGPGLRGFESRDCLTKVRGVPFPEQPRFNGL